MTDLATITATITAAIVALPFTVRPEALRADTAWATIITFARPCDGASCIVARRVWVAEGEKGSGLANAPGYWTEIAAMFDGAAVTMFHRRGTVDAITEAMEDWADLAA